MQPVVVTRGKQAQHFSGKDSIFILIDSMSEITNNNQ